MQLSYALCMANFEADTEEFYHKYVLKKYFEK